MLQHTFKCVTELSKVIWAEIIEETEDQMVNGRADFVNGLGDRKCVVVQQSIRGLLKNYLVLIPTKKYYSFKRTTKIHPCC